MLYFFRALTASSGGGGGTCPPRPPPLVRHCILRADPEMFVNEIPVPHVLKFFLVYLRNFSHQLILHYSFVVLQLLDVGASIPKETKSFVVF